jgi:hypothetical protein
VIEIAGDAREAGDKTAWGCFRHLAEVFREANLLLQDLESLLRRRAFRPVHRIRLPIGCREIKCRH